jgi:hypothetical protein
MKAAEFEMLFDEHVATPAASVGFERWGKDLWFERDGVRAALLRTELRYIWPFEFTLVIGHSCLRDFDDSLPAPRSRDVSEYPIKLRPSDAVGLRHGLQYKPWNLGKYPQEMMQDGIVEEQLMRIGRVLVDSAPRFVCDVASEVVLAALLRDGEGAWCEQRWIEDYRNHLNSLSS